MAIYELHVTPISREKGGRITRAAAYRAGERIRDERTREVYNHSDRDDVVHKEIFLPTAFEGNPALDWARDRSTLWNAAEHTDSRKVLLGRQVFVVLPPEVTPEQRTHLVRRYSQDLADRYGCAVDATIHLPRPWDDARFHHAHILISSRQVTPEGLGPRISLSLSHREHHQAGLGPYKQDFMWVREHWADVMNASLKEWGFESRVDHRSARARGLDIEPMPRIPHKILCMERKTGVPSQAGEDIRRRYAERVEARRQGPEELARVVARQKEEGSKKALERALQKAAAPRKRAWASLTREELQQRYRDYYHKNKDLIIKKQRAADLQNPEPKRKRLREAYWRNAELRRQKAREAYWRNPEPKRQKAREAYWRDPELERQKRRADYQRNSELERQMTSAARAREITKLSPERQQELALIPEDSAKANARPALEKTVSRRAARSRAHHKELHDKHKTIDHSPDYDYDHDYDYDYDYDFGP